jgi:hypothetical protein
MLISLTKHVLDDKRLVTVTLTPENRTDTVSLRYNLFRKHTVIAKSNLSSLVGISEANLATIDDGGSIPLTWQELMRLRFGVAVLYTLPHDLGAEWGYTTLNSDSVFTSHYTTLRDAPGSSPSTEEEIMIFFMRDGLENLKDREAFLVDYLSVQRLDKLDWIADAVNHK